jgi:hypothetical protein
MRSTLRGLFSRLPPAGRSVWPRAMVRGLFRARIRRVFAIHRGERHGLVS